MPEPRPLPCEDMEPGDVHDTTTDPGVTAEPDRAAAIGTLERALTAPDLADRMELAVWSPAPHTYRAAAVDGSVLFRRVDDGGTWRYDVLEVVDRNPLADQATDRFLGLNAERRHHFPARDTEVRRLKQSRPTAVASQTPLVRQFV